ncbi:NuoF family protein [Sphaerobacter thermophilus]|uniref:NADH dehydrogenase (Quinone) n=1 Tax=Sphaerobacter thermophilus (strain ATCC 49802 / DSM 20745 / KCCM 41009 / NCIMB 13125 / S 6022) TaxID=479434 RepID=D1C356_SPHTD|nr:NADH-ubiquinone oxidoreductase-F iron-sulfur binding region domain-containing protein [Sphaerobacter thermophilus]ACZ38673.1 NADH dehydrogenase (quinone) [Sphaerobacter thermophilus DSM 20745]
MRLTDRAAFEQYAAEAERRWAERTAGDRWVVSVGISECSIAKGARQTMDHLRLALEQAGIAAEVRRVGCAGWCWAEPYVEVKAPGAPPVIYQKITTDKVPELVDAMKRGVVKAEWALGVRADQPFEGVPPLNQHPFLAGQRRVLMADWGIIDPESIEDYIARGGYQAWIKAIFDMTPEEVVNEVKISNVRGRGGAGFPAGIKWESGRRTQAWPKYVIANSHEGEPNVFKDRRLIESNPHLVLEGIMIGCYALETPHGYNYVGGEHKLAIERFRKAVDQAYELGLLGDNVLGSGVSCHIRVRTGGGAYICGEGSALMYSVMGQRGQPRTKPPRSVEEGVWKRPTVLNNTETFANIPGIIRNGGAWYAAMGTEKSTGTKLITMQGPVQRIGVVEIEMGMPMREVIFGLFGGMREGYVFKGVQTGGVSAGPLREDQLDVPVDFDSLTPLGGMLGSGGFVVFDQSVCAVDFARYLQEFNRYESCAKCVPCRLGNPALVEIIERIRLGQARQGDLALIEETSRPIIDLSLCGLGQVAPMPTLGMIRAFPEDFAAHIEEHRCPAGVCPVESGAPAATAAGD